MISEYVGSVVIVVTCREMEHDRNNARLHDHDQLPHAVRACYGPGSERRSNF